MPDENLFRPKQLRKVKPLRGVSGAAGGATTESALYEDERGKLYVIKHGTSRHALLAVNEYVAYSLAREIELLTPNFDLRRVRDHICICTEWIDDKSHFGDVYQADDLRGLFASWEELLLLFGFDVFVMNTDRHDNNFLLLPSSDGFRVCAIDHDRTLYGKSNAPDLLLLKHRGKVNLHREQAALIKEVRPRVTDFDFVIQRIQGISNGAISSIVGGIHDELLRADDKQILSRVLKSRKAGIGERIKSRVSSGEFSRYIQEG